MSLFIKIFMMGITIIRWKLLSVILTRGQAVRIPYNLMVLELDKLMFGGKIENEQQAEDRAETIEAYLEATGYTWDDIINYEEAKSIPARTCN
jgi:hypothetical protein